MRRVGGSGTVDKIKIGRWMRRGEKESEEEV